MTNEMVGFGLLVGHLIGDYIIQNDWMAKNKTNSLAGKRPGIWIGDEGGGHYCCGPKELEDKWKNDSTISFRGHVACTTHCIAYTLAVYACSFWWIPWWGLLICFIVHWPIDRFRLARKWMEYCAGQKDFANGVFSPWSIIVVDNTFHLATLFLIGLLA